MTGDDRNDELLLAEMNDDRRLMGQPPMTLDEFRQYRDDVIGRVLDELDMTQTAVLPKHLVDASMPWATRAEIERLYTDMRRLHAFVVFGLLVGLVGVALVCTALGKLGGWI